MSSLLPGRCAIVCLLAVSAALANDPLPLMPWPEKLIPAGGQLPITTNFAVRLAGHAEPRLRAAVARFEHRLTLITGVPLTPDPDAAPALTIHTTAAGAPAPALGEDESYRLEITPAGATLSAPATPGALRGLATLEQLARPSGEGFAFPSLRIEDRPRFAWRGLMLDVARHWMPVEVVERNLDAMAAVKLNVLHWHLSDDQGFRVESKRWPKLHALGSDGHYYTQEQVRHVVDYAAARGIRVVPEFDMPGHTTAWLVGYPELACAPGPYRVERAWGIFRPTLDPSRETTYAFLDALIGEMASLFPDPYFHIGGDEVDPAQWNNSATVQSFARRHGFSSIEQIHGYFNRRLQAILASYGKTMIGWDEILAPGLAPGTVIQSWRGAASLAQAARQGYRTLLSAGYYLDHLQPAGWHYANEPMSGDAASLTPEQAALMLGGEACMWSEYVSEETVDSRLWPRAAAIAERFWSPREVTDTTSMYARLAEVSRRLDYNGIQHRSNLERQLTRLAGGADLTPLRVLADAVEAQGHDPRANARHYTSLVPLNRMVDAARPESEAVRTLELAARRVAAAQQPDAADVAVLRAAFTAWRDNRPGYDALAASRVPLAETVPVADAVAQAASIGLAALDYLTNGGKAPENWITEQKSEVNQCSRPQAELAIAAARPVLILLDALARP